VTRKVWQPIVSGSPMTRARRLIISTGLRASSGRELLAAATDRAEERALHRLGEAGGGHDGERQPAGEVTGSLAVPLQQGDRLPWVSDGVEFS
jgi:hypothetical protein